MDRRTGSTATQNGEENAIAALRASEQRFRALVEAAAQTVWTTDASGLVTEDSPSWRAFTGQTHEARLGEGWIEAVHPDDRARVLAQWRAAIAATRPLDAELRVWHAPTREWRLTQVRAVPVTGPDGAVHEWVGMNVDVAAQRRVETALQASEARYRTLLESIDDGFCVLEMLFDERGRPVDYRFLETNPAFAQLTGLVDAVGRTARELVPELEREWIEVYGRVATTGESMRFEMGSTAMGRWFDVYALRVGEPHERRVALLFDDVSARKRADAERERLAAEVEAERERLRSVVLHAPAPLALLLGPEHRYALVNDAYKRVSGGGRDVTGLTPREAFPELTGSGMHELFDRVYATGEPWVGPETLVRFDRDGTGVIDTWLDLRLDPVRDAGGRVIGVFNFAVDVTDQVRARREVERLLAESERTRLEVEAARTRSDAVLASIADAFYLLDREWRFTYVNDAAEPLLQTRRDALLGRTLWEAFPEVAGSPFEGPYREAMETGRVTAAEAYFPPLRTWFDVRTYPWSGGLMVHFRDIGPRKAAEAEREQLLRELEVERSRLAAVFSQTPSVLAIVRGPEHVLVMANDAYLALNGRRDVLGKPLLDAIPELRGQGFERLLDDVVATGEPFVGREVPIWLSTSPGAPPEERFFDFAYLPLVEPDATGAPTRVGVIAHGNDITEQVRARREVERARERADRLQALTAALAATTTPEEVADVVVAQGVAATQAATGMLALRVAPPSEDGPGEGAVLRHHGVAPSVVDAYARFPLSRAGPVAECLRTGDVLFVEGGAALRARFPDVGHLFDEMGTQALATVPLTVAGDVVGAMSFSWTAPRALPEADRELFLAFGRQAAQALERARLLTAERAARAEAEAANRAKSEFLAVMSHELRTPLNAIGGYAELMEMGIRGPVTAQQREDLRRLQASQRHLLGLINEVLNYAKLETGAVHYEVASVRARDALVGAEALIAPQAQAKGLALRVAECPPDLAVRADGEKLRQILVNLLSNAVKFTDRGGRVELACVDAGTLVHLLVRDTGIGVAHEQRERIFDPFVQVRSDLTRTAEGTGLGLAISRDLARGMGGDLTVESTPGVGSTFTVTLPGA
jgi:PAS domain S-box-containing protein